MLVDDEANILKAMLRHLGPWAEDNEIRIVTHTNPLDALAMVQADELDIWLVVTDLRMPQLSGSELLSRIKVSHPEILAILLSGYSDIGMIIEAINAGIFSFLLKPWDDEALVAKIEKAIEFQRAGRDRARLLQRLNEEMRWAGELQKRILEAELPSLPGITIDLTYQPLPWLNCGGDYYDVIELSRSELIVLIGDVAGHGVKAAFVTTILKSMIYRGYVRRTVGKTFSPGAFLTWLNAQFNDEMRNTPEMVLSFFVALIDVETGRCVVSGAGHVPMIVLDRARATIVKSTGPMIGLDPSTSYSDQALQLPPDAVVALMTDGLIENTTSGQMLDPNTFADILWESRGALNGFHPQTIQRSLSALSLEEQQDDLTLLTLQYSGKRAP